MEPSRHHAHCGFHEVIIFKRHRLESPVLSAAKIHPVYCTESCVNPYPEVIFTGEVGGTKRVTKLVFALSE